MATAIRNVLRLDKSQRFQTQTQQFSITPSKKFQACTFSKWEYSINGSLHCITVRQLLQFRKEWKIGSGCDGCVDGESSLVCISVQVGEGCIGDGNFIFSSQCES